MTKPIARLAALALLPALAAQEPTPLLVPGLFADPLVLALAVRDPDGAGPAGPVLVLGGVPEDREGPLQDHVTEYDPATGVYTPLGLGTDGQVWAVTVLRDGGVVVGGSFRHAGGAPARNVARWDGSAWHALGNGVGDEGSSVEFVRTLAVARDGAVLAGGRFTAAGVEHATHVAAFRDGRWHGLGRGVDGARPLVATLEVLPGGDVVAAGLFELAGTDHARNVARWDGSAWHALGAGIDGDVNDLLQLPGGDLLAGGAFTVAGTGHVKNVARWADGGWHAVGVGTGRVLCLARLPGGDVLAGLLDGGVTRWDGTAWREVGDLEARVAALAVLPDGTVFAGGDGLHRLRDGGWVTVLGSER